MTKNEDYTRGNLLDFTYHQNNYKLNGIDKQIRVLLNKLIL